MHDVTIRESNQITGFQPRGSNIIISFVIYEEG